MIRTYYVRALFAAAAICAAAAPGCRAVCGPEACEDEQAEKPRRLAGRMEGRMEEWKAKAHEHFHEEPVIAPHSRFHPVPTRPVFEAPSAEELAALFPPPTAAKDGALAPGASKPPALLPVGPPTPEVAVPANTAPADSSSAKAAPAITVSPSMVPPIAPPASTPSGSAPLAPPRKDAAPVQEHPVEQSPIEEPADSPADPPTRTAIRPPTVLSSVGVPSLNSASPETVPPAELASKPADEVRSTFRNAAAEKPGELMSAAKHSDMATDAAADNAADAEQTQSSGSAPESIAPELTPQPTDDHTPEIHPSGPLDLFGEWDGPLLWRAVKTPSGSLRAVPASFVDGY
jgi:hypothetical protein